MSKLTKADSYLYSDILAIADEGYKDVNPRPKYEDGTPAYTYSVNHRVRTYDLADGQFPICTLRRQAWKTGIKEILVIYQKQLHKIKDIEENGVNWWSPWALEDGTIGHIYGYTVAEWKLMDKLLKDLEENPYGRRHIMNLWQEKDLSESQGLVPCAYETIWNVRNQETKDGSYIEYLDMMMIQRSGDMLVASGAGGINEIQYACLLLMVAKATGYRVGRFTHIVANEQIYDRHLEQADELADRYQEAWYSDNNKDEPLPYIALETDKTDFFEFTVDDFKIYNYNPIEPQLKFELGI